MQVSSEAIRDIEKEIQDTIARLKHCSEAILEAGNCTSDAWDDVRAAEFRKVMGKVSGLMENPIEPLKNSIPKLDQLAEIVDKYNNTHYQG